MLELKGFSGKEYNVPWDLEFDTINHQINLDFKPTYWEFEEEMVRFVECADLFFGNTFKKFIGEKITQEILTKFQYTLKADFERLKIAGTVYKSFTNPHLWRLDMNGRI